MKVEYILKNFRNINTRKQVPSEVLKNYVRKDTKIKKSNITYKHLYDHCIAAYTTLK